MTERTPVFLMGVIGLMLSSGGVSSASISSSLDEFISQSVLFVNSQRVHFPNFAGEFLQRVALGSIQLPIPANSTSFTYSWNPELGAFERAAGSLGPVFVDRAQTIGEGKFDMSFSYQFANLTDFNGTNFGQQLQFGTAQKFGRGFINAAFVGNDFSLEENVFTFNFTYGLTNRWDANLLVPMLATSLDLDANLFASFRAPDLPSGTATGQGRFHDNAFGIGDLLLRTKYRFYDDPNVFLLAAAITLGMPSGSPDNFQGLGDFTITPTLIASRAFGRNDLHMNLGMEFDTMNGQRTRARYAIGTTIQPLARLAFLVDVVGSSGLDTEHFTIPTGSVKAVCGPIGNGRSVDCVNYTVSRNQVNGVVPRSDIIDLSTGIKYNPFGTVDIYLLAIIPLTQQGLRAAVVPTGGVEWTF
jgi:hypothetical protein